MTSSASVLPYMSTSPVTRQRDALVTQELVAEHGALLRRLAHLQQ